MQFNKRTKIVLVIIAVILIAIVAFLLTRNQSLVIVPKSYFTLQPGGAAQYIVTVPQGHNASLNGEFISNNLEVAVLNDSQMNAFINFGQSTKYNKTYANLTSVINSTFNANDITSHSVVVVDVLYAKLSPGRYHLLFYNPNPEYLITQNLTYWVNVSMVTPIVLNYTH
jgi:hypothetical protein